MAKYTNITAHCAITIYSNHFTWIFLMLCAIRFAIVFYALLDECHPRICIMCNDDEMRKFSLYYDFRDQKQIAKQVQATDRYF